VALIHAWLEYAGPRGERLAPLATRYHQSGLRRGAELVCQPRKQSQRSPLTPDTGIVKVLQRQPPFELA
jgi:hypothetical protein